MISCQFIVVASTDNILEQIWHDRFNRPSAILGNLVGSPTGLPPAGQIGNNWDVDIAEVEGIDTDCFHNRVLIIFIAEDKPIEIIASASLHEVRAKSTIEEIIAVVSNQEVVGCTSDQFLEVSMLLKHRRDQDV